MAPPRRGECGTCADSCRAGASTGALQVNALQIGMFEVISKTVFEPLGPTRVQIPPPPLTTRIRYHDAGSSEKEAGVEPASLTI